MSPHRRCPQAAAANESSTHFYQRFLIDPELRCWSYGTTFVNKPLASSLKTPAHLSMAKLTSHTVQKHAAYEQPWTPMKQQFSRQGSYGRETTVLLCSKHYFDGSLTKIVRARRRIYKSLIQIRSTQTIVICHVICHSQQAVKPKLYFFAFLIWDVEMRNGPLDQSPNSIHYREWDFL